MDLNSRYDNLVQEFERKLSRELEPEEKEFIKWMVEKENGEHPEQTLRFVLC